jgi:putative RNA 2'-phosphotransferase
VDLNLKARVSRYISSLLRHFPHNLKMDAEGFVSVDELLEKIRTRYPIDKSMILEIAKKSDKKRFEVKGNRTRALYGHTMPVDIEFAEDTHVKLLYYGTTSEAASKILREQFGIRV